MLEEQEQYRKTFDSTEKQIRSFHSHNQVASHQTTIKLCA